jgi:anti-sigma B factor antagonist
MSSTGPGTFRARAEQRPEGIVIFAEGDLDLVGAPAVSAAMPAAGDTPVILDMAGVAFMDSSGLRAVLEARQACVDAGRPFGIARPSEPVRRVLELVDLARELEVVPGPG